MLHGVWALLERSLRFDARSRWTHVLRLVALLAGYAAMWSAAQSSLWFGAPGLRFFQNLVIMNGLLIAAAGCGFFSSVITEEKEEGTLGLMLMTGLSPLGILLGKMGSRLVQAAFLVLLQIPFALLGVTLGGVTPRQVLASYTALLSLLFFTANLALLCSVLARNTRSASFWMAIATVGYPLLAWISFEMGRPGVTAGLASDFFGLVHASQFFYREATVLSTASRFRIVGLHELVHVTAGCLCFLAAWGAFGWATSQPDQEPLTRGWLGVRIGRRWWFDPGRVWTTPFAWKEFHFLLGGWQMLGVKAAAYFALWSFLWWYWNLWNNRFGNQGSWAIQAAIPIFSLLMALEAALYASRMFADEIRGQTWSTLALLPETLSGIAYRKTLIAFGGLAPVFVGLFWLLFGTETGLRAWQDVVDEAMFWGICSLFVTIVHFSAWYSLYVRWGVIPLAAATVFGPFALFIMVVETITMRFGGRVDEDAIGVFLCIVSLFVCAMLHLAIGNRLRDLASQ